MKAEKLVQTGDKFFLFENGEHTQISFDKAQELIKKHSLFPCPLPEPSSAILWDQSTSAPSQDEVKSVIVIKKLTTNKIA